MSSPVPLWMESEFSDSSVSDCDEYCGNCCEKLDGQMLLSWHIVYLYHRNRHVLGGSTADALQGVSPSRRQSGQKNAPGDDFQQTATFDQLLAECHRSKYVNPVLFSFF